MVEYICKRCNKRYNHKGEYDRHINRKNPCEHLEENVYASKIEQIELKLAEIIKNPQKIAEIPKMEEKYICSFCVKTLSDKYGLQRHIKSCKVKKQKEKTEEDKFQFMIDMINELKKVTSVQINHIEELKKEICTDKINKTKKNKNNTDTNTSANMNNNIVVNNIVNNQQNNINVNIIVNPYKDTNMKFLSNEEKKSILSKGYKAVEDLVKMIHFNKDKPENHNIYISNMKGNKILIYSGDDWNLHDRDDVIQDLYDDQSRYLCGEFNNLKEQLDASTIKKFENYINDMDEEEIASNIKKEIILILYNNRKIIEETRKLMKNNDVKDDKLIHNF